MQGKTHSVKYNFIMNFVLNASRFVFPLITFPYLAKVLLPEANGKLAFASSALNYFAMVASLGIPTYGIRACAAVRDDKDEFSKTVQEIFIINLIATVLTVVTYVICIHAVPRFYEDKSLFYINGISLILNLIGMEWVFRALEQYDYITIRSIVFKIISILFMFLLVHKPEDYIIQAVISVFAGVGSCVLNFRRLISVLSLKRYSNYRIKRHLKPIFILFAQSLAVSVYTNLDTLMLGFMKTDADVGFYHAAVKIKELLLALITSLGAVLLPRLSYYYKNNMTDQFKKTVVKSLNFTLLVSLPLSAFFVFYAKDALLFISSSEYLPAVSAMQIILIALIPIGITQVLGIQILTPMEKEKYVLYSVIVGAVIDFLLNLMLIPGYGAAGAALATTIAEFLVLAFQTYILKDLLIELHKDYRILLYLAVLTVSLLGTALTYKFIEDLSSFLVLLLGAISFFGIYGVGLLLVRDPLVMETAEEIKERMLRKTS